MAEVMGPARPQVKPGIHSSNSMRVRNHIERPRAHGRRGPLNPVCFAGAFLRPAARVRLATNFLAGAWKSEFVYDGRQRRRIERDYGWSGGEWSLTNEVRFVYDGELVIQHRDTNNLPTLTLTRGLDMSGTLKGAGGIGGLLSFTHPSSLGAQHFYYHADAKGNVTALVNGNQLVVGRYLYDPFGKTLAISGPKAGVNPYRFSSKPIHVVTGSYDFLRRWYSPDLQRWVNRDPIGERGDLNLYRFANNNAVGFVDRHGLCIDFAAEELRLTKTLYDALVAAETAKDMKVYQLAMETEAAAVEEMAELQFAKYTAEASFGGFLSVDVGVAWYVAPVGVVGAAATAGAAGIIIGSAAASVPVIGGGNVGDFWGDALYSVCPDCFDVVFR